MKILIIQDTDWIRRNPYQHTHLAERLVQKGHEIRVIDYEILWKDEGKKELLSKREVHHVSRIFPDVNIMVIRPPILKISVFDYLSMVFTYRSEINRQIKEFKPDLIWGNDILTTFLAYRAAKKNRIPTLFYSIDIDYRLIPQKYLQPIGKMIESWNIRNADLVLSINEGLREYTIRMGALREKTDVIRAGIDTDRYNPLKVSGGEIRKQYGIAKGDIVLFFMGWLYHFSGLKEVIIELAKVIDIYPNLKFLVVGDGDAYQDLVYLINKLELNHRVIMAGKQPFNLIPDFIASADICLLPAHDNDIMHDIVPIKLYEYLAMEKPVISSKLYGVMKEFGEEHGLIFVDRPDDVVSKALELFKNGNMILEGKKGRKFVENCSWNEITTTFEYSLKRLLCKE